MYILDAQTSFRLVNLENIVKKLLTGFTVAVVLVLAPFSTSFAACGVGSKIWGENAGTGGKVIAFTTNVFTFKGISTSFEIFGCTEDDNLFKSASNQKIRYYASQNLDHLAVQCARGQGEHLDAIAHLIKIRDEDLERFQLLTQVNFGILFPHDHTNADEMLDNLRQLMIEDEVFSSYVGV